MTDIDIAKITSFLSLFLVVFSAIWQAAREYAKSKQDGGKQARDFLRENYDLQGKELDETRVALAVALKRGKQLREFIWHHGLTVPDSLEPINEDD